MKNPFEVFSPPGSWHEVQQPAGGRNGDPVSTDFYTQRFSYHESPLSARFSAVKGSTAKRVELGC
jgi:hypothetical protein